MMKNEGSMSRRAKFLLALSFPLSFPPAVGALTQPASLSAQPAEAASRRLNRVYELLAADRREDAAIILGEILENHPDYQQARVESAYMEIREKRWDRALPLLDSILAADPGNMRLHMQRGYARQSAGDAKAAGEDFALVARRPGEMRQQALDALSTVAPAPAPVWMGEMRDATALVEGAYEDLRLGRRISARRQFELALKHQPENEALYKQLAYMSLADDNPAQAAEELEGARRAAPKDYATAMELGFVYESLNNVEGAKKSFTAALASPSKKVRDSAAAALDNIHRRTDPFFLSIDASPMYMSRFNNKIAFLEAKGGYQPRWRLPVSVYLGGRYTQDTRSSSGESPDVYADNRVWFGPGIKIQPKGMNAALSADWGISVNLLRTREHPDRTEYNGRVLLSDYHFWEGPARTFVDAGGSVGYYSRYRDNVIGYLQLRAGIKAWDNGSSQISVYVPGNGLKDSNKDFFNNLVETGVGLEIQPWTRINLKLRGEYLRGWFTGIEGRDRNPYGPTYGDFRVTLAYSGWFTRKPKNPGNISDWRNQR